VNNSIKQPNPGLSAAKGMPAIAAMPAVAGMQAKAVMHIVAVTPATSNSKDDINSMTATTVEMQATGRLKATRLQQNSYQQHIIFWRKLLKTVSKAKYSRKRTQKRVKVTHCLSD
jgi:hypothetical protein